MKRTDNYLQKGRRERMVENLIKKGITSKSTLDAMRKIPRHFFLDPIFEHHAYEDKPFSIGEGQTISQPYTVAFQTQLLDLKPSDSVLEIGTGSGYQAAILFQITKNVYSIEQSKMLFYKTSKLLKEEFKFNINLFLGDGSKGHPKYAPYDAVIVTAAAPEIPKELLNQLKINGKLVIPVGDKEEQKMMRVTKKDFDCYEFETFSSFSFVPLLGANGWN